jgi:hypothetical protein
MEGITPPEVAKYLDPYIRGKVVCDVGCGDGTFMEELNKYAKKVIGIEENTEWASKAAGKDFEVYQFTSWHQPLPAADVYYLWTRDAMGIFLKAEFEGTRGTFVFGKTVRPSLSRFLAKIGAKRHDITDDWWIYITEL